MTNDSRQRALAIVQEYGWNNTSFQTLEPYFEYWFDPSGPGVVAYYRAWGTWVVAGPDEWEELYVTGIPKFNLSMLIAVLMAFVRSHPTRFAFDTLVRLVRANVSRVRDVTWQRLSYGLAATLSIWIVVLSQSDGAFWFGSELMLRCWIVFDCLMVGVLLVLGYGARRRARYARWLVRTALLAVLSDVGLTAWQAGSFLSVQPWNWWHGLAWAIALAGPIIASLFLLVLNATSSMMVCDQKIPSHGRADARKKK